MYALEKYGIDSIGVRFGYGKKKELEETEADIIAESVEDLRKILLEAYMPLVLSSIHQTKSTRINTKNREIRWMRYM